MSIIEYKAFKTDTYISMNIYYAITYYFLKKSNGH